VDGSIDWDKQTEEGNTEPRSLENFGMIAGIKIESDADSEGEVVFANDAIPAGVSVSAGNVSVAVVIPQSETEFALMEEKSNILEYRQKLIDQAIQEKPELMTKLDNEIANHAKWNNSGKKFYKLIDSFMSVRTKRGMRLDKYIGEGELVDHMKAVPPPLTGNYMPPFNILDIDELQMVYGKKATDSSEIKTNNDSISHSNDSVLFYFSDRYSDSSTNNLQTCDSSMECSRPNHSDHDSTDSISSVSAPASESRDIIVIYCDRQEDFPSVCSIETDVKSSKTLCNKFGSFNKESHFRKHKSVASKSCYQNTVSAGQPNLVSAGQPNPVSAGDATLTCNSIPLFVSAGDGILGKFDKKSDEGYIVGYSISSKAYRVYNLVSRKIEETMHLKFLENKPFIAGTGQAWIFDIDYLTDSLNYSTVSSTNLTAGSQVVTPSNAGSQEDNSDSDGTKEADRLGLAFPSLNLILGVGSASIGSSISAGSTPPVSAGNTPPMSLCASPISTDRDSIFAGKSHVSADRTPFPAGRILGKFTASASSERFPRASGVENSDIHDGLKIFDCPKSGIFTSSSYDEEFSGPDENNLESSLDVKELTTVAHALVDLDWVEAMQAEMQQFRNQKVWVLVTLPDEKRAIGTKWILKNKRDAKGIVCRNKARLVAQGHRQEEGIDYTDVFAPVARIEAIRLFLAFATFMGFMMYQIDVKSSFLYGKIAEEVYVTQPRGFEDPDHPQKVYKVVKALYGLHQAPRAWYARLSTFLLKHRYRRGTIDKTQFIKKDSKDIMLVQVYIDYHFLLYKKRLV
nr:putative ribonuclease H-like domain-containing protein [Tanacetum cinerariifolium]